MTTLSTLIGPAGTPLGLGEATSLPAAAKGGLWQRLGGVFRPQKTRAGRRSSDHASARVAADDSALASADFDGDAAAPVEALRSVVDDTVDAFARRALATAAYPVSAHAYSARESGHDGSDDGHDGADRSDAGFGGGPSLLPPNPPRRRSLWGGGSARRDAALDDVRHSMGALASLLAGIQQNMEQQGARQQELIACLAHLPRSAVDQNESLAALRDQLASGSSAQGRALAAQTDALESIRDQLAASTAQSAESESRSAEQVAAQQQLLSAQHAALLAIGDRVAEGAATQNQSLVAIRQQIECSAEGQERFAESQVRLSAALDRLGGIQETTGAALTSIGRRIDEMGNRDAAFVASLERVSDAMQTVSRASEASAGVLDRVQVGLADREDGVRRTLDKHQTKFNALMAVAIAVSTAALAVVAGVGYLVLTKIH